jgi:hypothetical protein
MTINAPLSSAEHSQASNVGLLWAPDRDPVIVCAYLTTSPGSPEQRNVTLAAVGEASRTRCGLECGPLRRPGMARGYNYRAGNCTIDMALNDFRPKPRWREKLCCASQQI